MLRRLTSQAVRVLLLLLQVSPVMFKDFLDTSSTLVGGQEFERHLEAAKGKQKAHQPETRKKKKIMALSCYQHCISVTTPLRAKIHRR